MHPISIFLIILIALLIMAGRYETERLAKNRAAIDELFGQQVAERGGQMVTLTKVRGAWQHDPYPVYEVTFTGRIGKTYTTIAKYDAGHRKIYWEKSPGDWLAQEEPLPIAPAPHEERPHLDSPLAAERLTAVRQLAQTHPVSQRNLVRLAQMAVEDDDPQVREEAKAIVRRS
ncbi:MAG: hypothetical protein OT477_16900 [Chloroflexi bacterium]|nr:hypothetical protein [Chloroflexota bacterium]